MVGPKQSLQPIEAQIESFTHDGRGVARVDNKVWFIEGALPGEQVSFCQSGKRRSFNHGVLQKVIHPAADRVVPQCPVFGICGGCALQHVNLVGQVRLKQQFLVEQLARAGVLSEAKLAKPITGPGWAYRRKARLGVRLVPKKGGILVGFRERHKSYITPLDTCLVLDQSVASLLPGLPALVESLSCPSRLPQIEVAVGDGGRVALVFRTLEPLLKNDLLRLTDYGRVKDVAVYCQFAGPDSINCLHSPDPPVLHYDLEAGELRLEFRPTDFVQVNSFVNQSLIAATLDGLELSPGNKVLDLFCGIGNFSLPLATRADSVLGVEIEPRMIAQARANVALNRIENVEFECRDLYGAELAGWRPGSFSHLLLDPPRSGALEVVKSLVPELIPLKIAYVSCNPATLARDAAILVEHGYQVDSVQIVDMFPQTAHIESLLLLGRK